MERTRTLGAVLTNALVYLLFFLVVDVIAFGFAWLFLSRNAFHYFSLALLLEAAMLLFAGGTSSFTVQRGALLRRYFLGPKTPLGNEQFQGRVALVLAGVLLFITSILVSYYLG